MPTRLLIVSSLLVLGAAAQQASPTAEAALQRTGEARQHYERAWRQTAGAERQSYEFLLQHMPESDIGKVSPAALLENVRLSHTVRGTVAWGSKLSDELFHNYVVPYAQANETRESWRPMMVAKFLPLVKDCKTAGEAGRKLNESIFNIVGVHYSTKRRRADQSPSESIAQGRASCTGLSILLADACRACCVPARLISVRWPHKRGNHTWVEIWDGTAWRFVGADEPDPLGFDRAWFVGDAQKCAGADRAHRVWAVSFAKTDDRFATGWGAKMWGHDVTARYAKSSGRSADAGLRAQIDRFFAADAKTQASFSFDMNLDAELKTKKGDARLRKLVWESLQAHNKKEPEVASFTSVPKKLSWQMSDATVKDHHWLHVDEPQIGQWITAWFTPEGLLNVSSQVHVDLLLDARWIDLSKDLKVGRSRPLHLGKVMVVDTFKPAPSLRTLCATMQERGDPQLAASWVVKVRVE